MSTNKENKLAVLFDADNVPYSRVREMLDEVAKYGNPTIKEDLWRLDKTLCVWLEISFVRECNNTCSAI